ncbi:MAG TPA: NAD-dependent epimerase/dehydratase family protein [Candidatus Hydrogenedentes bacterium]|nr:NAD-dependent epimerase/dehydratase family protein [Candidatus Hydrogenedentota bacterium]HIO22065.1 NAD-dependent epimerase/dehydratase family protein [Nitrospirales bacterium]
MAIFLVTGGAGFIGSNVARSLVGLGHSVRVLDNLYTGFEKNLEDVQADVDFVNGSILNSNLLASSMAGVDYCLHLAAIPSVPRSINNPIASNEANVEGSVRVYLAARDAGIKRVVSSSSSSVYGNNTVFPATEEIPLSPISPYAVSKMAAEHYAEVFSNLYDIDIVRLRYFNVFGPYQNPKSEYSAVIPKFIHLLLQGERPVIHGDGSQSRDFTFIENVVKANIGACDPEEPIAGAYNIAYGASTSVLELATELCSLLDVPPEFDFEPGRTGDVPRSLASIKKAKETFGFDPAVDLQEGLRRTVEWYRENI